MNTHYENWTNIPSHSIMSLFDTGDPVHDKTFIRLIQTKDVLGPCLQNYFIVQIS